MKPYNERLAMIDAAVECHKGVWPFDEDVATTEKFNCGMMFKVPTFTRQEFEQRAKELGWINGYKWGVEYETNGKKPDLPDGVVIDYMIAWHSGYEEWVKVSIVNNMSWFGVEKFRIVDERYRPKAVIEFTADSIKIQTPSGEYKDVIDLTNGEFNKMNNDWYENGELPPVGEVVEVMPTWDKVVIVAHHEGKIVFFNERLNEYNFFCNSNKFRPLRTETDKLVEQMCDDAGRIEGAELNPFIVAAIERLAEQGYRKIKPMSEDEFVQDVLKHFETKRFEVSQLKLICESLRKLHKAGCRFIDQGE